MGRKSSSKTRILNTPYTGGTFHVHSIARTTWTGNTEHDFLAPNLRCTSTLFFDLLCHPMLCFLLEFFHFFPFFNFCTKDRSAALMCCLASFAMTSAKRCTVTALLRQLICLTAAYSIAMSLLAPFFANSPALTFHNVICFMLRHLFRCFSVVWAPAT